MNNADQIEKIIVFIYRLPHNITLEAKSLKPEISGVEIFPLETPVTQVVCVFSSSARKDRVEAKIRGFVRNGHGIRLYVPLEWQSWCEAMSASIWSARMVRLDDFRPDELDLFRREFASAARMTTAQNEIVLDTFTLVAMNDLTKERSMPDLNPKVQKTIDTYFWEDLSYKRILFYSMMTSDKKTILERTSMAAGFKFDQIVKNLVKWEILADQGKQLTLAEPVREYLIQEKLSDTYGNTMDVLTPRVDAIFGGKTTSDYGPFREQVKAAFELFTGETGQVATALEIEGALAKDTFVIGQVRGGGYLSVCVTNNQVDDTRASECSAAEKLGKRVEHKLGAPCVPLFAAPSFSASVVTEAETPPFDLFLFDTVSLLLLEKAGKSQVAKGKKLLDAFRQSAGLWDVGQGLDKLR